MQKFIKYLETNYNVGQCGRLNKRQAITGLLGFDHFSFLTLKRGNRWRMGCSTSIPGFSNLTTGGQLSLNASEVINTSNSNKASLHSPITLSSYLHSNCPVQCCYHIEKWSVLEYVFHCFFQFVKILLGKHWNPLQSYTVHNFIMSALKKNVISAQLQ